MVEFSALSMRWARQFSYDGSCDKSAAARYRSGAATQLRWSARAALQSQRNALEVQAWKRLESR